MGKLKLNEAAVLDILTRRISKKEFAALYGVDKCLISQVQLRKVWAHVDASGVKVTPTKYAETNDGRSKHPLYKTWVGILMRTTNQKRYSYNSYAAKGIKVCDRWKDDFFAFASDVGQRPSPQHTLDRIDNNGDYCPGNVRWATKLEQQRNTMMASPVSIDGVVYRTTVEAAAATGMSVSGINYRISSGRPGYKRVNCKAMENARKIAAFEAIERHGFNVHKAVDTGRWLVDSHGKWDRIAADPDLATAVMEASAKGGK
jgi:hypothetical protein